MASPHDTIEPGDTLTLTTSVRDADGNALSGVPITWSTGHGAIARISQNGQVTARTDGLVTLTAAAGNDSGSVTVLVRSPIDYCADDAPSSDPGCNLTGARGGTHPMVSGSRIVCEGPGESGQALFLFDLETRQLTQITPAGTSNHLPSIDGDRIVYARAAPTGFEFRLYDIATGRDTVFVTNVQSGRGRGMWIQGSRVVWHENRGGNWDVYLFDFESWTEQRITSDPLDQADPSIHGNIIAWADQRHQNRWDLYVFDLSTGIERRITPLGTLARGPVVTADRVLWRDWRSSLYAYDPVSGQQQLIPTSKVENGIEAAGRYVAWIARTEVAPVFNEDVFVFDLATGTEVRLTRLPAYQVSLALSAEYVAWQDDRLGSPGIYVARQADLFR